MYECRLPEWLEPFRVEDAALAAAYEATSPGRRAWIKTTLALVSSRYGETASTASQTWENRPLGFAHSLYHVPAPWAVVVLTPDFASPPRLAAALMTARLAQVDQILVVRQAPEQQLTPFPADLLATLDLVGIEHIFTLPTAEIPTLLEHLTARQGMGRLLLHADRQTDRSRSPEGAASRTSPLAALRDCARVLRLPVWEDEAPQVGCSPLVQVDEDVLFWAHPDARLTRIGQNGSPVQPPAVFDLLLCATLEEQLPAFAPLRLASCGEDALTGAWLHATLSPAFFQNQTQGASFRLPPDPAATDA